MKKKKNNLGQKILVLILSVLCLSIVIPFVLLVSISLSKEIDLARFGYSIIPKTIDLTAYRYVFKNPESILRAYGVTFTYSILTMIFGLLLMSMLAYPLSRKNFKDRKVVSFIMFFTMLFSGGLVPSYILITRYLHLDNTIWVYILPSLVNSWNVFMIRAYFQAQPTEIVESAYLDGATEMKILFQIIFPISKPVLATVALTTFLAQWNNWYTAMLYIDDEELISLQYLLQRIMENINLLKTMQGQGMPGGDISMDIPSETVRMAMAVVVAGPALFVFPFFQKYFVKGLTVGSVKG